MTCVKCAWKVQRGSCENLRVIRGRSCFESESECASIGRLRLNHSWHFRMTFPREFSRTLNLVNILIWPSAYIFLLWQPHSVRQLIMQTNIQKIQSTAMLPWRLPSDKTSSTLDVINFKRLLREAHRQQVAAAVAVVVEATTMPRKRQRKLQASDRKRAREIERARGGGDCAQIPLCSRIHS